MTDPLTRNGKQADAAPATQVAAFPVDSFREAAVHLRRPFTPAAVKFKIQSTSKNGDKAMCVAFIDARLVVERLNLIVPHLWHDEYQPVQGGLLCRLTVDGITRHDIGDGQGKAGFSDALKRAAVKFGIGVPLYAIPRQWLPIRVGDKFLSDDQDRLLRERYSAWLRAHGVKAFGEPLDHGDQDDGDGSQGDAELHPRDTVQPAGIDVPASPISDEQGQRLTRAAEGLTAQTFRTVMAAHGVRVAPHPRVFDQVPAAAADELAAALAAAPRPGGPDQGSAS